MFKIVELLKSKKWLLTVAAFLYSTLYCWYRISYWRALLSSNCIFRGAFLKNVRFDIGGGGDLYIGPCSRIYNSHICMNGSGHELLIEGGGTCIKNCTFLFIGRNSHCHISNNFTMEGGSINLLEGKSISLGSDCMFSSGLFITVSDFHSIVDANETRINFGRDIRIGNHVWLGADVKVLKGSVIPDGCVVGTGSIVTGTLPNENAIYAGAPARCVKTTIKWNRER